ncbi:MAG: ribosome biogenesis GTP-binding protein YihA/YsxC [bacterium]
MIIERKQMKNIIQSAEFIKGITGTDIILQDDKRHIVFTGRSNVGKSSVINSLTRKRDLVKSSSVPGKTQQLNFFLIDKKFYFVDLPGYGYARLSLKQRETLQKLILWYLFCSGVKPFVVVLIIDIQAGLTASDKEMVRMLSEHSYNMVIVANKVDRLNQKERQQKRTLIQKEAGGVSVVLYSAKKHIGRDDLLSLLICD